MDLSHFSHFINIALASFMIWAYQTRRMPFQRVWGRCGWALVLIGNVLLYFDVFKIVGHILWLSGLLTIAVMVHVSLRWLKSMRKGP